MNLDRRTILAGLLAFPVAAHATETPLPVLTSFSVLDDLVRQIGGERVSVSMLVQPGGDAHVYEPAPADVQRLQDARLIVINGLGLEGWIPRLIEAANAKAKVVVATTGLTPRKMEGPEAAEHGGLDPHAWQSVTNVKLYAANIRDGLSEADPAGANVYAARTAAFDTQLDALEKDVKAAISTIPPARRMIITTHDAFGYFAAAYGVAMIAPQGVSTETEASARDVAKIIRQIKAEHIPAVFLENVTDPRLLNQIAVGAGAKIGGTLFSDSLSPPDGPAATYIAMVRHNISQLTAALAP